MDTKGEKSSEVTKLAGKNSKSKDGESLNPNPIHTVCCGIDEHSRECYPQ